MYTENAITAAITINENIYVIVMQYISHKNTDINRKTILFPITSYEFSLETTHR